jgi:hypothetical protein
MGFPSSLRASRRGMMSVPRNSHGVSSRKKRVTLMSSVLKSWMNSSGSASRSAWYDSNESTFTASIRFCTRRSSVLRL